MILPVVLYGFETWSAMLVTGAGGHIMRLLRKNTRSKMEEVTGTGGKCTI